MRRLLLILTVVAAVFAVTATAASEAERAFRHGQKLEKQRRYEEAFHAYERAAALDPKQPRYIVNRERARQRAAFIHVNAGVRLLELKRYADALRELEEGARLDPTNDFTRQQISAAREALAPPTPSRADAEREAKFEPAGVLELHPNNRTRSWDLRGGVPALFLAIGAEYGIRFSFDESAPKATFRFRVDDADFAAALRVLTAATHTLVGPVDEKAAVVAADTPEKRSQYDRLVVADIPVENASAPAEYNELAQAIRTLLEMRFVQANPSRQIISVRDTASKVRAAAEIVREATHGRPQVLIELETLEVHTNWQRDIGLDLNLKSSLFQLTPLGQVESGVPTPLNVAFGNARLPVTTTTGSSGTGNTGSEAGGAGSSGSGSSGSSGSGSSGSAGSGSTGSSGSGSTGSAGSGSSGSAGSGSSGTAGSGSTGTAGAGIPETIFVPGLGFIPTPIGTTLTAGGFIVPGIGFVSDFTGTSGTGVSPSSFGTSGLTGQGAGSTTTPPLATFGGNRFGFTIPGATFRANLAKSVNRVVANITVRAADGQPAIFTVGSRYPIVNASFSPILFSSAIQQQQANGTLINPFPSFTFEDLGIKLKVTPRIHSDDEVTLRVESQVRALTGQTFNSVPTISNRESDQVVRVVDGQTTLITGVVNSDYSNTVSGIPFLATSPVLGVLFGGPSTKRTSSEIIILLTPHILRFPGFSMPAVDVSSDVVPVARAK